MKSQSWEGVICVVEHWREGPLWGLEESKPMKMIKQGDKTNKLLALATLTGNSCPRSFTPLATQEPFS